MSRGAHREMPAAGGGAGAKIKATPRALFSCGIFSTCTHPALSPTATPNNNAAAGNGGVKGSGGGGGSATPGGDASPALVEAAAASAVPSPVQWHRQKQVVHGGNANGSNGAGPSSSSSSSSSSASQSFTQWRLPVHHPPHAASSASAAGAGAASHAVAGSTEKFAAGDVVAALRAVEREMEATETSKTVPPGVVAGVVAAVREPATARLAAKVLLVMLLEEGNREAAVEAGAASAAVEAVAASGPAGATAERALAALELLCTAAGGTAAVRREALAAPVLACAVEGMSGRGRECAIGVLAAIYGGEEAAGASPPPPEVVKGVVGAMQGECSARGRRKGAQLLRALQEGGRLGLAWDGVGGS
ncbi:hypothetical protein CFC21_008914 [Triticum aestivum]|uniref:U-box domain-containing protein n=2 Tax=Triticum aestivum TaxID=4565 RepID=A0A9R1ITC0_WHEAT|nr:glycine-rich protein 1-like [Triticum aestivum]KAF6991864.1 hypothetical protein CFC21_008914 [Triticum aestivum]